VTSRIRRWPGKSGGGNGLFKAGSGDLQLKTLAATRRTTPGELTKPTKCAYQLRALGDKRGSDGGAQPFLDALKDKDPHVRLIAAGRRAGFGRPEASHRCCRWRR